MGQAESSQKRSRKRPYDIDDSEIHQRRNRAATRGRGGQVISRGGGPSTSHSQGFLETDRPQHYRRVPFSSQPNTPAPITHYNFGGGNDENVQLPATSLVPVGVSHSHTGGMSSNQPSSAPPMFHQQEQEQEEMADEPMSSQPNKIFKLEMNIDSSDGKISGKVVLNTTESPTFGIMDIPPPQLCAICNSAVDTPNPLSQTQSSVLLHLCGSCFNETTTVEELNQVYDSEEVSYLHKLAKELMTDVTDTNCFAVVGLVEQRKKIREEIFFRLSRPDIFQGLCKMTTTGVLLTGNSGNGKTAIAKLMAKHVNHKYLNVQPYFLDSTSKYKRLVGIFRLASEASPIVIVFDSIDQMFEHQRKLQQLFANEFQKSVQRGDQIIIVGTTTTSCQPLPSLLEPCFQHKIHLPRPHDGERRELIQLHMKNIKNYLSTRDFELLADMTRYYSRGDIVALCKEAIQIPIYEVPHDLSDVTLPTAVRPVRRNDFVQAVRKMKGQPAQVFDSYSSYHDDTTSVESEITSVGSDSSSDDTLIGTDERIDEDFVREGAGPGGEGGGFASSTPGGAAASATGTGTGAADTSTSRGVVGPIDVDEVD